VSDLSQLKLFITHPHPCSYLDDEEAVTLFVDPTVELNVGLYSSLSAAGFRRSGAHLYRPRCPNCQACVPARIPTGVFKYTRQQKRCLKRNADLSVNIASSGSSNEHYQLYERYINLRHSDGDMFPPSREQFDNFLVSEWGDTHHIEFRLDGRLIAVAVCDQMEDALSAVYTYFEPDLPKRSLGVLAILQQIQLAEELGLSHVYLGYWIKNCSKMSYKTDYRPLEVFVEQNWLRLS
jgi:arginine-tRNA-protein transferase